MLSENTHLEEELEKSVDMLSAWFKGTINSLNFVFSLDFVVLFSLCLKGTIYEGRLGREWLLHAMCNVHGSNFSIFFPHKMKMGSGSALGRGGIVVLWICVFCSNPSP